MENPFKKTVEVKFVKGFTSPVLGNVWIGRVATVKKDQAERFIKGGLAVLNDGKSEPVKAAGQTVIIGNDKPQKPAAVDPYKGMNAAQKKAAQKAEKDNAAKAAKDAKDAAEAHQARIDVLLDKKDLTEEEKAELQKLEAESFNAEGKK
jgi:hypothetical protein